MRIDPHGDVGDIQVPGSDPQHERFGLAANASSKVPATGPLRELLTFTVAQPQQTSRTLGNCHAGWFS
jgi:hypothetical protein